MIVMAIDQSLTSTGLVILAKIGDTSEVLLYEQIATSKTLETDNYTDTFIRSRKIAKAILSRAIEFNVDQVILEGLSMGSVGNATRNLAILLGMIVSELGTFRLPEMVAPTSLKKFATGNGRAKKQDMLESIRGADPRLWEHLDSLTIKAGKYDIADAYWLGQYYLRNNA